ncbi:MAG: hypothetical protein CVU57_13235 [Deltaproteobacteria bacterium HGW-Deltaproteobacteria-15]|nr:MAG: hypothetical protein CVU57_13235 [Deltaproteobacteria bacterium HGW-Deltaproteobacteria-15]
MDICLNQIQLRVRCRIQDLTSRSQKSEIRDQKIETRNQRDQKSEDRYEKTFVKACSGHDPGAQD